MTGVSSGCAKTPTHVPQTIRDQILLRVAVNPSAREKHVNKATKLHYLAGDYETVVACLARVLDDYIGDTDDGGSEGVVLNESATAL